MARSSRVWGDPRTTRQSELLLPESARPDGIFELYLYGGMAAWDTFYAVPELCDPAAGGAGNSTSHSVRVGFCP